MFTGEGLGASRDNFSTNLARLKNLRQWIIRFHRDRDEVLAQVSESEEHGAGTLPEWTLGIDLHWLAQDQREWLRNEYHTTLEMMFIYLMSMLDVFFGQWGTEHHLWPEDSWPPATAEDFGKAGLIIHPAPKQQLIEYRARRNVLVHRGGIADAKYCERVRDKTRIGQRLPVEESYLDTAADFIDHLVAATAVARYAGPPRHEARDHWPSFVARIFAKATSPASGGKAKGRRQARRSAKL